MSEPAVPPPPRGVSLRLKLLALVALGLVLLGAHQGVNYRRLQAGDPFAAGELLFRREVCRGLALTGETPQGRVAALRSLESEVPETTFAREELRVFQRAAGDPAPLVRAVALHGLLATRSHLQLDEALALLTMALADEGELTAQELAGSGWTEAVAGVHAQARPGEPFRVALLAAALVFEVDDPPQLAFTPELFQDEARRKALEAAIPAPFLQRKDAWPTAVADAQALLEAWRPWLLEHPEPAEAQPGVPLARLRAALKGHPTRDPGRWEGMLEAARRKS